MKNSNVGNYATMHLDMAYMLESDNTTIKQQQSPAVELILEWLVGL